MQIRIRLRAEGLPDEVRATQQLLAAHPCLEVLNASRLYPRRNGSLVAQYLEVRVRHSDTYRRSRAQWSRSATALNDVLKVTGLPRDWMEPAHTTADWAWKVRPPKA